MSDEFTGACVVLIPAADDPVAAASSQPAHITMAWLGEASGLSDPDALRAAVREYGARADGPISAAVKSRGTLGDEDADVVFVEGEGLAAYREGLVAEAPVAEQMATVEQYPEWTPHVTLGYPDEPAKADYAGETITFDRIGFWQGDNHEDFPLGKEAEMPEEDKPVAAVAPTMEAGSEDQVPWYGVLAPLGVESGDGRIFEPGTITYRDFPLPLKGMRKDLPGHDESVVVGNITNAWEEDGLIKAEGFFATNEDAQYFLGLRRENAMRGLSVDLDMAQSELVDSEGEPVDLWSAMDDPNFDPNEPLTEKLNRGRLASATICAIPAFQEAFFNLGTWVDAAPAIAAAGGWCAPMSVYGDIETFISEGAWDGSASRFTDAEWKASCVVDRGEGDTAKTRYAVPIKEPSGELSRAGVHAAAGRIGQVDAPPDAIAAGKRKLRSAYNELGEEPPESITASALSRPAYTLVASAATTDLPKKAWFENPQLDKLTPLTVTKDGQVYGHAAGWGVCHIGMDRCTLAPKSASQYAYFHTGVLETDEGDISVGNLTFSTGHADLNLGWRPATEHYDNTGAVFADVRAGEDKFGIWIAGQMRPGLTPEQIREFRAAGLSGDWREIGGVPEMVAALAVNVQGFPIPRTAMAASGTRVTALVAAAIVMGEDREEHDQDDAIKTLVKAAVREVREEDKRIARAGEIRSSLNMERREEVLAALGTED